jgi:hypothetical protein
VKKVRETETSAADTSHEIKQRNYLSKLRTRNGLDGLLPASPPELPCERDLDSLNIGVGSKYRSTSSVGDSPRGPLKQRGNPHLKPATKPKRAKPNHAGA